MSIRMPDAVNNSTGSTLVPTRANETRPPNQENKKQVNPHEKIHDAPSPEELNAMMDPNLVTNNQNAPDNQTSTELVVKEEAAENEDPSFFSKVLNFLRGDCLDLLLYGATGINIVSAGARIFGVDKHVTEFINGLSMFATKAYLADYSYIGVESGVKKKSPILLSAYGFEGLSIWKGDVSILYLIRGLATALDVIPAALESVIGDKFSSWWDCADKSFNAYGKMLKEVPEFIDQLKEDFWGTIITEEDKVLGYSSLSTICGSVFGLTINNFMGAMWRNLSGFFSDLGLLFKDGEPELKSSGKYYLGGSIIDTIGWIVEIIMPKIFGGSAEKIVSIAHGIKELAIASDRIGGYKLLRYNQTQRDDSSSKKELTDLESLEENHEIPEPHEQKMLQIGPRPKAIGYEHKKAA